MLGMPVWVTDPNGNISYVNERAHVLLGASAADSVGLPCHEFIAGHTQAGKAFCELNCPVRFLVSMGREVSPFSLRVKNADGQDHGVRLVVIAAHRREHERPHIVHCIVDEDREDRVRRYLDRIATRSHTPPPTSHPVDRFHLTQREKQILQLLVNDRTLHQIADELFLSYSTVRNHVQHILHKLGVHSILEAVAFYLLSED